MQYKVDFDIDTFPFWSGAKERVKDLTDEQRERLGNHIEEMFCDDENVTDTAINDYVWHDWDCVQEAIGIDDDGNDLGTEEYVLAVLKKKFPFAGDFEERFTEWMETIDVDDYRDDDEVETDFSEWNLDERVRKVVANMAGVESDRIEQELDEYVDNLNADGVPDNYNDDTVYEGFLRMVRETNENDCYTLIQQEDITDKERIEEIMEEVRGLSGYTFLGEDCLMSIIKK